MPSNQFVRDPNSVLDYRWDFSGWLADGETIQSATVTVAGGITKDSQSNTDTTVTVWISGGQAGKTGTATCHITTTQGRQDDRTIFLKAQGR